jgi:hypothetical protein
MFFDSPQAGSAKHGTGTNILCKETNPAQTEVASRPAPYAQQLIDKFR